METENRYTRLKSIKEFGYDVDFEVLSKKAVIIAGVGGIGAVAGEIMVRCGLGKVFLIDMDTIEEVNLNRLGFCPSDVGKNKVDICKRNLQEINPDVSIVAFHTDITAREFEGQFETILNESDLLLMGLDNISARQFVNIKCVKLRKAYVDVGASRSGLGGYVQMIIPGETPCYQCTRGIVFDHKIVRGEPCTASLPTTMSILAAMQSQIALNYLLSWGSWPQYQAFNALTNSFETQKVKRDPNCFVCSGKIHRDSPDDRLFLKELEKQDISNLIQNLKEYDN